MAGRQIIQVAVTLVLARILSPSDFGLIAAIMLFTGLAGVFVDGGFSAALIQRRNVDIVDETSIFWFNLLIGLSASALIFAIAPMIALFYEQQLLADLMRFMSLGVAFASFGAIHTTLLSRRLNFQIPMQAGLLATLVSGSTAVWLALEGHGVWALAVQSVLMAGLNSALLWWLNDWRPKGKPAFRSIKELLPFSSYHFAAILGDLGYTRLYTVLLGKFHEIRDVGYYTNADALQQVPSTFLVRVISRVAFPLFAAAQEAPDKIRRGVQVSVRGMMLLNAPIMLFMAALADPIIEVLLGRKWQPTAPILSILCLAGLLYPVHAINLNALLAQGHAKLLFKLELQKKLLGVGLIISGSFFGVLGVAWSQVVFSIAALGINAHYTKKLLGYDARSQLTDISAPLCLSMVLAACLCVLNDSWQMNSPLMLALVLPGAFLVYALIVLLARFTAADDIIQLFGRARHR